MTDILLFDKSYERIAPSLRERVPEVGVITWSTDGGYRREGQRVDAGDIAPRAGWIGADVFAARCIRQYGEVLERCPSMEWVQSANAGLDHPIYQALAKRGVRLTKSGAQSIPITEYVLGHALAHYQCVHDRRRHQLEKSWKPHRFRELWHSTWLMIGYGHIGRGVAKRAKAFDCEVIVIRRSQHADEFADTVAPLSELDEHLPRADFVVLACPANEETRNLADEHFFSRMKKGAMLINVARGSLVDENALLRGLDRSRPEHAVLDVFETEPLPESSPLWSHPGVTITAHTSNAGNGTRGRGDELFLGNLESFLAGAALLDEVDPAELIQTPAQTGD